MTSDKIPVIIGIGQINDRPKDPFAGLDSRQLMNAALIEAETDSGVSILGRLDWLGVEDQISFPDPDIAGNVARALPVMPRRVVKTADASGDGPVRLINDAANLIAEGEIKLAAVVGGEAMRTANQRAQIEAQNAQADRPKVNKLAELAASMATPIARKYRLFTPIDVYPLYENATRAAWGQTLAEAQDETAAIWSGFSHVAAANPAAWLHNALTPEQILDDGPGNPMLSFPYRKLMVANGSVNQGAAVLIASLGYARELGIPEEKLVYIGHGASSHESDDFLLRDSYAHSASLTTSIEKALAFNQIEAHELDCVELYSCFPCVPKMARRVLGWPLDRPHSVYGGLTFGGGPIGNCMTHAAAAMTLKLRANAGNGMIVANGGYATHNHSILLSSDQARGMRSAADYHVDAAAAALRNAVPDLIDSYEGAGTVETYVVPFGRDGAPSFATIVARSPAGQRFLATVPGDDGVALDRLVAGRTEPIGMTGNAAPMPDGRLRWTF